MKYNLIPRELKLSIYNENTSVTDIVMFEEPSLWELEYFWRYLNKGETQKAMEIIGFEYHKDVNDDVLLKIVDLIYGKSDKQVQKGFYPSTIDFFCKRYGQNHKEFMQNTTFSNLITLSEGVEYNSNIEAGKPGKNSKYLKEEMTPYKLDEYMKIADEVEEMEKKLKR